MTAIAPPKTESTHSKNALLLVVCLAQFMVILDVAIVNVALPSMRAGLHFSTTGLQWVVNAYTLQQVLHYDAIEAGLGFLPMTLSIFAASTLAPRVVGRFGPRPVITAGMLSATVGLMLLSGVAPGGTYVSNVLLGSLLSALGMGFTLVPATIVAMQGVERSQSGVASGLLNTSRLVGGALGLAVLSTIAAAHTKALLSADGAAHALTSGFGLAFTVGAALALTGAAVAAFPLREPPSPEVVRLSNVEEEHEALAA